MSLFECSLCIKESPCHVGFAIENDYDSPTECPFAVTDDPYWVEVSNAYRCKICGAEITDICSECCEITAEHKDAADNIGVCLECGSDSDWHYPHCSHKNG